MKLTKYWYISLIVLFSCQNDEIDTIEDVQQQNTEVDEIKMDNLSLNENILSIDTSKENDSVIVAEKEIIKKTHTTQKNEIQNKEETSEPAEYRLPKEMYFKFIKSQKFYDDSVAYYNSFMRSEYWRKKYGYPNSDEYYKKYLLKWEAKVNSIKGQYDWSE